MCLSVMCLYVLAALAVLAEAKDGLLYLVDPALGCRFGAHLYAGLFFVELLDDGAHLLHAGREVDHVAVVVDGANR